MSRPFSTSGFTFLEIMVGMTILALGLVATTSAMFTAINANDQTHERNLALQAMESKLEDILTSNFDDVPNWAGAYGIPGLDLPPDSTQADVLQIDIGSYEGDTNLHLIEMTAEWARRSGSQSTSMQYIHYRR